MNNLVLTNAKKAKFRSDQWVLYYCILMPVPLINRKSSRVPKFIRKGDGFECFRIEIGEIDKYDVYSGKINQEFWQRYFECSRIGYIPNYEPLYAMMVGFKQKSRYLKNRYHRCALEISHQALVYLYICNNILPKPPDFDEFSTHYVLKGCPILSGKGSL